jgi:hypothetical protein
MLKELKPDLFVNAQLVVISGKDIGRLGRGHQDGRAHATGNYRPARLPVQAELPAPEATPMASTFGRANGG